MRMGTSPEFAGGGGGSPGACCLETIRCALCESAEELRKSLITAPMRKHCLHSQTHGLHCPLKLLLRARSVHRSSTGYPQSTPVESRKRTRSVRRCCASSLCKPRLGQPSPRRPSFCNPAFALRWLVPPPDNSWAEENLRSSLKHQSAGQRLSVSFQKHGAQRWPRRDSAPIDSDFQCGCSPQRVLRPQLEQASRLGAPHTRAGKCSDTTGGGASDPWTPLR